MPAQHHGRSRGQARRLRRGVGDLTQGRAARQGLGHEAPVDARQLQQFIRPAQFVLVEQQCARGHRVVRRPPAAEHKVQEILDQQPLVRAGEDVALVLGHPQDPHRGVHRPDGIAADGKALVGADVLLPPLQLRRRSRVVPTDERVQPLAVPVDRHAVHAHTRDGHRANLLRVVDLPHRIADRGGGVAPYLLRQPDRPLRMLRVGVVPLGRTRPARHHLPVQVVNDRLQTRRAQIDPHQVVHRNLRPLCDVPAPWSQVPSPCRIFPLRGSFPS